MFANASGVQYDLFLTDSSGNSGGGILQFRKSDAGGVMALTQSGNVGIGTTKPGKELHVAGDLNLTTPTPKT